MSRLRLLVASEPMEYGVLSYLEHLFAGLDRSRWEPALAFSPYRMAPQARALVARLVGQGVRVRRLRLRRGPGIGDLAGALQLGDEIRAFRPDVVHLHSTKAGLLGRPVARLLGVPVVYTAHGTSWQYTGRVLGRLQRALERALRPATDLLLSVCPEEAQAFAAEIGFAPARIRVVPNGVQLPDVAALAAARASGRAALGLSARDVWAIFVGRLTREKGLDVLLDALGCDAGVGGLLVVGTGADRRPLEAAALRLPVPVRFCGYREDVGRLLAAADVFVQPSRSEGLPFSVLEAMAHGLPVVGSRVGGLPGLVDGCGQLVAAEDPDALATALRRLATDPAERHALGMAGRTRVGRDFGLPDMLAALQRVYEEVAGTPQVAAPAAGEAA